MINASKRQFSFGKILGKSTEPDHTQTVRTGRRGEGWGDRDKGGSPCLEILTVAMVTRHNRQQRRRGLHYLQGNSRGRRRKVFGVASPQRAQLPQDRRKECEGVT